jgi:hypothetical protein
MYRGKVIITHQLTGTITGEEITDKTYKTKQGAITAAKKLSSKIEYLYSVYSNHDVLAIEV